MLSPFKFLFKKTDIPGRHHKNSSKSEAENKEYEKNVQDFEAIRALEMLVNELDALGSNKKIADLALFVNMQEQNCNGQEDNGSCKMKEKVISRIGEIAVSLGKLGRVIIAKILDPLKTDLISDKNNPPQNISPFEIGKIVLKDTGMALLVYFGGTVVSLLFGILVFHNDVSRLTWAIFIPSFGALATILFKVCSSINITIEKRQVQKLLHELNNVKEGYDILLDSFHKSETDFKNSLTTCRQLLEHYYDKIKLDKKYRSIVPLFTISEYYINKKEPTIRKACHRYKKGIKDGQLYSDLETVRQNIDNIGMFKEEQKVLATSLLECRSNISPVVSFSFGKPKEISDRMDNYRNKVLERLQKYCEAQQEVKTQRRKGIFSAFRLPWK